VTINSLSPGMITWMDTPDGEPELWKQLAAQTPVGRNSQPEDYVTATVFLASEGSSFVHGTNLIVDGGWSVW
jgi:3-oxoacyl-[acyl-carrier protein] reductase